MCNGRTAQVAAFQGGKTAESKMVNVRSGENRGWQYCRTEVQRSHGPVHRLLEHESNTVKVRHLYGKTRCFL